MKRRRILRIVLGSIAAALGVAMLGFVIWASLPMRAEAEPLAAVEASAAFDTAEYPDGVVLTPTANATGDGLVFIAGARVDPAAYASKLSGLAEAGVTVVIARPILNFAILELRPLSTFTALAADADVDRWFVGGHSLGGVKACMLAPEAAGLILFGSYCANDLSDTDLAVLSIGGENDGLTLPSDIDDNAANLPASATFVELPGANHAQFGDYGVQRGDGESTTTDAAVRSAITASVLELLESSR